MFFNATSNLCHAATAQQFLVRSHAIATEYCQTRLFFQTSDNAYCNLYNSIELGLFARGLL